MDYKWIAIENSATVLASAIAVSSIAFVTGGSLHCLWGLLILINITTVKGDK